MASSATTAPAVNHHRADIQGLRAVAVLLVVAFHAGLPTPGGFIGVDVFFVISGFVITAMLMRELEREGRLRLGRFYLRRFIRLAPALAVTVGAVMLASFLFLSPFGGQETASKTGLGSLLLGANFVIAWTTGGYFDSAAENNPLLKLWSLAVEEQRSGRFRVGPIAVVGAIGGLSLALALIDSTGMRIPGVSEYLIGFYGPLTRVWEFAAGALLALGGARLRASNPRVALLVGSAGAVLLAVAVFLIDGTTPFPGPWTLLPVLGTALLLAAGSAPTVINTALASRALVWIGNRSYSIYLWHWPIIVFARLNVSDAPVVLVLAAVASFLPAYASYRWVEQPVRASGPTGGAPFVRLVAVTLVPPLVAAAALGFATSRDLWTQAVTNYDAAIRTPHAANEARCSTTAKWDTERCTWNADATGPPIYLVGDSNADHFSEAMIDAATALGRPLVMWLEDGCSYIRGESTIDDRDWRGRCESYPVEAEDYLLGAEDGVVVVANAYGDFRKSFPGDRSEPIDVSGPASETTLFFRLFDTVQPLQEAGHEVLLVQTIPHWDRTGALDWQACTTIKLVLDGCQRNMPLSEVEERQGAIGGIVAEVAESSRAGLLDVTSQICPEGSCSAVSDDGMVRYRDGIHITVEQSRALAPMFERAIARRN